MQNDSICKFAIRKSSSVRRTWWTWHDSLLVLKVPCR